MEKNHPSYPKVKILEKDEVYNLFLNIMNDNCARKNGGEPNGGPYYWDDNEEEWINYLYKHGYRLVKIHLSPTTTRKEE